MIDLREYERVCRERDEYKRKWENACLRAERSYRQVKQIQLQLAELHLTLARIMSENNDLYLENR